MKPTPNKPIGDDIYVFTEGLTMHLYNAIFYGSMGCFPGLQSLNEQDNRLSRALDELKRPIMNEIHKETT